MMLVRLVLVLLLVSNAWSQEWPQRPVRIIVPFPPGGAADALPRIVADKLTAKRGQPFIIENKPGATGSIGAEAVFRAEPDGYTLLATPPAPLVINPSLYAKLAYDPWQFVPVTVMASIPSVMLVPPRLAPNSVMEFIAFARGNSAKLNYASQGTTSVSFLTTEHFMALAGLKIAQVPYKGSGPALTALLAGEVDLFFDNLGTSLQHVRSGRLKALAVCGERRYPGLPDVPAMTEIFPGFVSVAWFGMVAPPNTPGTIAEGLSSSITEILKMQEVRDRFAALSAEPIGMTPAQMADFMRQDAMRWREAIRIAGVKPE